MKMSVGKEFCQDQEMYAMDITDDKPCDQCSTQSEDPRCPNQNQVTGLNKMAARAYEISKLRHQDPVLVFKHMAGEVLEAQEARLQYLAHIWRGEDIAAYEQEYADELADVIICALSAAARSELDIEAALERKMMRNEQRAKDGK